MEGKSSNCSRKKRNGPCLEEKVEIGGVRGGSERLLEEELELFNGSISRNPNGGGFPGYRPDLDF